jgi:hypothetical protein
MDTGLVNIFSERLRLTARSREHGELLNRQKLMDQEQILNKVNAAVHSFLNADSYLLVNDIRERSITHKLAEHLQMVFRNHSVDCEYNKNAADDEKDDVTNAQAPFL